MPSRPLPPLGDALAPVGRARVFACHGDASLEVWRFAKADAPIAARLASLGVSGFEEGGEDDEGAWLARRPATRALSDLARGERMPFREALGVVGDVARVLAVLERASLSPGRLGPRSLVLAPRAGIDARELVHALVGASEARAVDGSLSLWTPPEQADGAPWDKAANRYVLGLAAYRLIAGVHAFEGAGVRHGLGEQRAGAPPFDDAIARELAPGVQSFVLGMLSADPGTRPRDAAAIASRCESLANASDAPQRVVLARASAVAARAKEPRLHARRFAWAIPLGVAALVAAASLALTPHREETVKARPSIAPARLEGTRAEDCAGCHARQAAEWQRSVMAHAAKSPLFGSLESVVEEQVGRDARCPEGAGALRVASGEVCKDPRSGVAVTGAGGEHWCVSCHAPGENVRASMPAWRTDDARSRAPVRDLLSPGAMEGISCVVCHTTVGPVAAHASARGAYEGNATWRSPITGATFLARPEDNTGRPGIGNSGYALDAKRFLAGREDMVHAKPSEASSAYLRSSEFCGACHDVRLFGSDVVGVEKRGEHFKRLRNAYSEWRAFAQAESRAGRTAATCVDCHMSLYPGACEPGSGDGEGHECPTGTHFAARAPGAFPRVLPAPASAPRAGVSHYFTSVDLPLSPGFAKAFVDDDTLDGDGLPLGLARRQAMLLRHTFSFAIGASRRAGASLEIPIELENRGAGHRVPAGFSQEREIWVELTVRDARGDAVYEVGKIADASEDLRDKRFVRVNTDDTNVDAQGRPLGVFGADVIDGPDVPAWSPSPSLGGATFRGRGLINLQNGFLRCVRCIGIIDGEGRCNAGPGQGLTRADRYEDGVYDLDTGECQSNLRGHNALFETYFPVGALDASRGVAKAPDAIVDTRSAPPGVRLTYTYEVPVGRHAGPFTAEARLRFRSFPPFLVRAFAAYEAQKSRRNARPSGPQVTLSMLERVVVVELAEARARVE